MGPVAQRRTVDSLTGELLTVYEELSLLYSLTAQFGRLVDEEEILAVAVREAMEVLPADCGWAAPNGCRLKISGETVDQINRLVLDPLRLRRKAQVISHALAEEYRLDAPDAPARFLACCLQSGETSLGYLCLGRKQHRRIFTSADLKLINAVASLTAVALDNARLQRSELEKRRLENELELARRIQQSLLPRDFACASFLEAHGIALPCYEVGGDYFDLFSPDADRCLLVMADVCGKGPAAALQAARLQGIVHAAARHSHAPSLLIAAMNECIRARSVQGSFVTAFVATLDRGGELDYANAGHNPPLWIRSDGQVAELPEAGLVLGFMENAACPHGRVRLAPGDLLLLYTDGITDAENKDGEKFGVERLLDWARLQAGRAPAEVEQSLIGTISEFCGEQRQADDLTLLAARFTPDQVQLGAHR